MGPFEAVARPGGRSNRRDWGHPNPQRVTSPGHTIRSGHPLSMPGTSPRRQPDRRSPRFWLVTGLALWLGSLAILFSFDVIHVGDKVLDDRVPGFVFVILAVTFWGGISILLTVGAAAIRRWFRRRRASACVLPRIGSAPVAPPHTFWPSSVGGVGCGGARRASAGGFVAGHDSIGRRFVCGLKRPRSRR